MATLRDIAGHCGVTAATVSLALNNHPRISESRRQEIQSVARELGYHPNAAAQRLRSGRSNSIGILWSIDSAEPIRDLTFALMAKGYISHLVDSLSDPEIIKTSLNDYARHKVGGLVMQTNRLLLENKDIQALLQSIPNKVLVIEDGDLSDSTPWNDCDLIYRNHLAPWQEAIAHFRATGRKRVVLVGQMLVEARELAYTRYLQQSGFPVEDSRLVVAEGTEPKTLTPEIEATLLTRPLPYDAVLTPNDELAAAIISLLARNGISVPGHVGVVGFNDEPMSRYLIPPLATVDRREKQLTQLLLQRLFERLANPRTETDIETITMRFIRRESAG